MATFEVKNLQTEGFNTVYAHGGEGQDEAVFFLHGSGPGANGLSNWKKVLEVMGEKYEVFAPDFVGFGNTEIPENTDLTFWQWTTLRVKQVLRIMEHHNIEKAHLVGNSMGGVISMHAIMYDETKFDKLVLMGSGGGKTPGPTPEIIRMKGFFNDPTIESLRNLIKWFVYDETVLGDDLESIIQTRYENLMRSGMEELYPTLFPDNPMELLIPPSALRRIEQKTLMIHGYEDQFVPVEGSLDLLKHIPNAELVILKECGHWAQIEKSERFLELVDQFLTDEMKVLSK